MTTKKKPFHHRPPGSQADQDRAWAAVVQAYRDHPPGPHADDDLPEGDDLPDDPEGHLVMGVKR